MDATKIHNAELAARATQEATVTPVAGRYVVTDAEVRKVFGHPDTDETLVPHYLGAPLSVVIQPIADRAFAAGVASVNVPEVERAAAYRAVTEWSVLRDNPHGPPLRDFIAKYAPAPEPEPWREWVRPSDECKFRTHDEAGWERYCAAEDVWTPSGFPVAFTLTDLRDYAAHFPQDGAK